MKIKVSILLIAILVFFVLQRTEVNVQANESEMEEALFLDEAETVAKNSPRIKPLFAKIVPSNTNKLPSKKDSEEKPDEDVEKNFKIEDEEDESEKEDGADAFFNRIDYRSLDNEEALTFTKEDVKYWFPKGAPKEINFTKEGKVHQLFHPNGEGTGEAKDKTLYVTDEESAKKYSARVNAEARRATQKFSADQERERKKSPEALVADFSKGRLPKTSYDVYSFAPGKTSSKSGATGRIENFSKRTILSKINVVDFPDMSKSESDGDIDPFGGEMTQEEIEAAEREGRELSAFTLSLGYDGVLTLKIEDGAVFDESKKSTIGNDFEIHENPFRVNTTRPGDPLKGTLFYETASVSVSKDGINYETFFCDKSNPMSPKSRCSGAKIGGMPYDLSLISQFKGDGIRYIRITDQHSYIPPELRRADASGSEVDAVLINNAYSEKDLL